MPHNEPIRVEQLDAYRFRIPKTGAMRTDGILYATPSIMCGAANYAFANRQCIAHQTRECFRKVLGLSPEALGMQTLYDICHNIGKIETHTVKGNQQKVLVHRKGATRSFPAGRREIPDEYRAIGQPVLTPGTMGTSSYILVGTEEAMQHTFGSTCHGAGRVMSRMAATKKSSGQAVEDAIKQKGIHLKHRSFRTLVEEAPFAYKNVDAVVDVCHNTGIARRVAKLLPMGVIKP